ncbi:VOC family protein [Aquabacterium sp. J223]|uniref:VOC family protein n=1 Tax=Aquabacterium sp. J223 TaxID=2898431 RepID=UPI0021AD8750|nr:VOC family protein [Aquabacterium sp. J223]UUX97268.1 extradiol dioxygenase [Aquabacterium sp. J223]
MLHALDHFTIRSGDLDRTQAFYGSLLGLHAGPRPPFAVPGRWLYAQGRPLVHVLDASGSAPAGRIDHVALRARGRAALEERLRRSGVPHRLRALPDGSALQLFVEDPDGALLELVFHARVDR